MDLTNNADLFTTVLDMINIMIHSTLITDRENGNSERNEENRKHYNYHALVKKLKKEIGDKTSPSLKYLRQMLPLPKLMNEVIATEPFGTETNEKGNKVKGLNCDKKPGMQVSEKQKISPWDILEGTYFFFSIIFIFFNAMISRNFFRSQNSCTFVMGLVWSCQT